MRLLPRPAGYEDVKVNGMNDLDQVVGYMTSPQGWRGFVWNDQDYTYIFPPAWANTIEASAINNWGEVQYGEQRAVRPALRMRARGKPLWNARLQ